MPSALTIRGKNGKLFVIQSEVGICVPFLGDIREQKDLVIGNFKGIWDTGATGSVITPKVVDHLKLKPTGKKKVNTANGSDIKDTYLVNIALPSNVMIQNVVVTEGNLGDDSPIDVLIGMDVITLGDFVITNKNDRTVMSFRIPSLAEVDYVADIRRDNMIAQYQAQRKANNHNGKKKKKR